MGRPTIFLVDDDEFIRSVLADMLRPAGYAVAEFPSAEAFVAALRPGMSGCLILDMQMPGMSGVELQAELRRREIGLPIIFLSGHEDVPTTVAAIKGATLGLNSVMLSPARPFGAAFASRISIGTTPCPSSTSATAPEVAASKPPSISSPPALRAR